MAVDIGSEAEAGNSYQLVNRTVVNKNKPSTESGEIDSIEIWARTNIEGLRVGTFYTTDGNTLKCRDSDAIAGVITAGEKVTKAVSITVEIGDYIGCYYSTGTIENNTTGGDGLWFSEGEHIDPNDEDDYTFVADDIPKIGGYFAVPGWTGKISGVTNPAKIMGVPVANIKSVKGVE